LLKGNHWEVTWSTGERSRQEEISHSNGYLHLTTCVDYTQESTTRVWKGAVSVCWQNHSNVKVCLFSN